MTDIIETTITTEIAEYNATAAALADLRSKYEKVLFPVETPKGMKDALAARKELRDIRFGLEKMRKEIKEPALRRCQLIDSEAKEITARLTALEDPIDKQIKAEEQRKEAEKLERERVERERVAAIRTKIDFIKRLPFDSANDSAEDIATTIDELEPLQIDDSYAEFAAEAQAAKEGALIALQTLHVTTKAREEEAARLKAEREELDRQRAELERMRAELEAAKAPEPVAEPTTPAEPVAQYSDIVSDGGLDPRNNPEPVFQLAAQEDTSEPESAPMEDANDLVSEFAGYTAMQFIALADKVAALGYESFAEGLRKDGQVIAEGHYNEQIKVADWKALADADKRMALAAHACVSVLEGDDEFGTSSLRQFNQKQAA
ncbi:MAG: DUF1351 domain-containing protein [Bryobacteraceae bacterium]